MRHVKHKACTCANTNCFRDGVLHALCISTFMINLLVDIMISMCAR